MGTKIEAYKAMLTVVKEYSAVFEEDSIVSQSALETVIENLEVSDKFGIPLQDVKNNYVGWLKVGKRYDDFMTLGKFGEDFGRTISWSDNGEQPNGEWLLTISFPTGAYIFGDSYPKATFNAFFDELKTYNPKFCDTANNALYFTKETAKSVYDDFWPIFNRYKRMVADEMKAKRKLELEEELAKLSEE